MTTRKKLFLSENDPLLCDFKNVFAVTELPTLREAFEEAGIPVKAYDDCLKFAKTLKTSTKGANLTVEDKAVLASFTYTQDSSRPGVPSPRSVLCDALGDRSSAEGLMRIRGLLILFTKALRALPCTELTLYTSTSPAQLKALSAEQTLCTAGFVSGTRRPKAHEDTLAFEGALGYDITEYSFSGRDVVVMEPDAAFRVAKVEKGSARLIATKEPSSVSIGGKRMSFCKFFTILCLAVFAALTVALYFSSEEASLAGAPEPIRYRVYGRQRGWSEWTISDNVAGFVDKNAPLEAMQVVYPGVKYQAYLEGSGWTKWRSSGKRVGVIGNSTRIEAFKIKLPDVKYTAHIAGKGWINWVGSDEEMGIPGNGHIIDAIKIIKY